MYMYYIVLRPSFIHCVYAGLPSESGRFEILQIHTSQMRANKKLDSKVNLRELATKTRNFSGAEIEGLVRSAQATAMNKIIKVQCRNIRSNISSNISLTCHV